MIEKIMEQVQVYASSWSLVGGMFDDGSMMDVAEAEKKQLQKMIEAEINKGVKSE